MVSGQWSVVSGQWLVVSGQWSVVSGQLSVVSGQLSMVSCQWSGKYFVLSCTTVLCTHVPILTRKYFCG
ncbi:hypothetical protein PN492_14230 [Dolichospermum circinale CS-537/01]|uniref:Uncharacterized protein n=1 Tax=Dolichospermum circinale CS-537/01 TaxID=3021739 RepID=A0ABT5A6W6_9CYAN|nr:hypothetical protein [Dolichospermum circinale]MDB9487690.1 hypothetical protein [Dolichospermum circinale CS-537/01]